MMVFRPLLCTLFRLNWATMGVERLINSYCLNLLSDGCVTVSQGNYSHPGELGIVR